MQRNIEKEPHFTSPVFGAELQHSSLHSLLSFNPLPFLERAVEDNNIMKRAKHANASGESSSTILFSSDISASKRQTRPRLIAQNLVNSEAYTVSHVIVAVIGGGGRVEQCSVQRFGFGGPALLCMQESVEDGGRSKRPLGLSLWMVSRVEVNEWCSECAPRSTEGERDRQIARPMGTVAAAAAVSPDKGKE